MRAIKTLRSDVQSGKDAKKLEGVGKSMAAKIDEIIETGTLAKYNDILADPRAKGLAELSQVHGVGRVKHTLYHRPSPFTMVPRIALLRCVF